ncbi:MAG: hypothetical protein K2K16_12680 [Ruminococcus sp.]|nr:hypothetical protein [Ruminococcus sp.]
MKNKLRKFTAVMAVSAMMISAIPAVPYSNFSMTAGAEHTHTLEHFPAKEPTCTESGAKFEYWHCTDCDKYFRTEDCNNSQITYYDCVIPRTEHTTESIYYSPLRENVRCKECGKITGFSLHHFTEDGECEDCGFSVDEEYNLINDDIILDESLDEFNTEAKLEDDGYELDIENKTLILGNVYINGSLVLPADGTIDTIVIADGAKPIIADDIDIFNDDENSPSLTITGKGTLLTEEIYNNSINAGMLTVTGGAEVIAETIMWNSGTVQVTDNGRINFSTGDDMSIIIASKITMDNMSEIEIARSTLINSSDCSGLEEYVPDGYTIYNMEDDAYLILPENFFDENGNIDESQFTEENLLNGENIILKRRYADGIGEHLAGHSLSLDGNIGVNFYMELDKKTIADENAYMQFTLPDDKKSEVKVSEARTEIIDGNLYYIFSCSVSAKNTFDKITAQMITSAGAGETYTYSVIDYLMNIDSLIENNYDDENYIEKLGKSMQCYYMTAVIYFDGNMDKLFDWSEDYTGEIISDEDREEVENGLKEDLEEYLSPVDVDTLSGYEKEPVLNLPEGVEYYGSSLLLKSDTFVRHYFKVASGTDTTIFTGKKNGYYYIDSASIPAGKLGEVQTTKVGTGSVEYSPLNYVSTVLDSESADDNLKNICKALYLYDNSAKDYQNYINK